MPTKSTKSTGKSVSKKSTFSEKGSWSKVNVKKSSDNKNTTKKVVIKRRKVDLVPTRASAVAIASQANRAKKQALIERFASWENIEVNKNGRTSTMIPLWVWIFFWCSLLLFCISFYQAIIRPQFEKVADINSSESYNVNSDTSVSLDGDTINSSFWDWDIDNSESKVVSVNSRTAWETIQEFFRHLSSKEFDVAFNMFTPSLQRSSEILEHFTSFRMEPFISWIEWDSLLPTNIQFVNKTDSWKDKYKFDISYVLSSNKEKFDETWEFVLENLWEETKIASVLCVTSKCSYHPIFWPENFGLMK